MHRACVGMNGFLTFLNKIALQRACPAVVSEMMAQVVYK